MFYRSLNNPSNNTIYRKYVFYLSKILRFFALAWGFSPINNSQLQESDPMTQISKKIANTFGIHSEAGVTAIEYGLLAALIALAVIAAVTLVGTNLNNVFTRITTKVS
jgi:pilus assembly protein Flp/PilA